ncbi:MAG: ribonuclease HII [Burkholderiaceae bacterium]|jgi:ribonuclease HII
MNVLVEIGVDEAGRGPLAGPVCAGAVVLPPQALSWGLADSKRLSARRREALEQKILLEATAHGLGWASVEEIDAHNILVATCMAMARAVSACVNALGPAGAVQAHAQVLVDGSVHPQRHVGVQRWPWATQTIVAGDATVAAISAASILAKQARDRLMTELDALHPGYGLAKHAGYGTVAHLAALQRLGPSSIHRRSFGPVAALLARP